MIPFLQLLLFYPAIIWRGVVASYIWGWFAAPIFHRQLSVYEAVGMLFVLSMFRTWPNDDKDSGDPWADFAAGVFRAILYPLAAFVFAWIWHALGEM